MAISAQTLKRWFKLRYHPDIMAALYCNDRFQFYRCGRRAYKSELMKRKGVLMTQTPGKHGPRLILFTAPTQKQAKKIFWNDILALSSPSWIETINRTELSVTYKTGAIIEVAGLDQPQRIEGRGYDWIFVDESADVKPSAIAISIMPALADRSGGLTRGGVPKRTGKGARDYNRAFAYAEQRGVIEGTNIRATAFSWKSDAVLSEQELSIQRALLNEKDYREQFEATIETAGGGIWHAWGSDNIAGPDNVHGVTSCDYDPKRPIIIGQDYNISPMCWVLAHDIGGQLHIFDELWELGTHTQACLDKLVAAYGDSDTGKKHQAGFWVYGDATGKSGHSSTPITNHILVQNETRLANLSMRFPKGNPGFHNRVSTMNAKIRTADGVPHMFVSPDCEKVIEDIEQDCYKEDTMIRDESDKMRGHMCDAIGYICTSRYPIRSNVRQGSQGVVLVP